MKVGCGPVAIGKDTLLPAKVRPDLRKQTHKKSRMPAFSWLLLAVLLLSSPVATGSLLPLASPVVVGLSVRTGAALSLLLGFKCSPHPGQTLRHTTGVLAALPADTPQPRRKIPWPSSRRDCLPTPGRSVPTELRQSRMPRRAPGPSPAQLQLNKRLTRCDSAEAVMMEVDAAEASGLALTTVNIVTAMHRLAKCAAAGSTLQQHDAMLMLQRVEHELAQASAAVALDDRALTTLAWSLGSLYQTLSGARVHCKPRVESVELAEQVRKSLGQIVLLLESRPLSLIPAQGLSNVAWSCAKCNIQGEATGQLLDRIAEVLQVGRAEQTWNAQDLSNLAWAYGRLRTRTSLRPQDRAALGTISRAALNLGLHRFRPQGLTNLLWALAHLNVSCAELSDAICQEAANTRLRGFSSQEVSNLAWASSVLLGKMPCSLCTGISCWLETSELERPQELSITLWAFAKTQAACPTLVGYTHKRILDEPEWLDSFSCQALSNLLWSLAKVHKLHKLHPDHTDHTAETIGAVLAQVHLRTLSQFKPQEISQMMHALATWGGRGRQLLQSLEEFALTDGLGGFEENHLACISWVCGLRIKRSLVGRDAREASDDRSFGVSGLLDKPKKRPLRRGSVEVRIEALVRQEALARGLECFAPGHLSQLVWANALADKSSNDLLLALRHELLVVRNGMLCDFSAAALVHVGWAIARMLGQPSQLGSDILVLIGDELQGRSLFSLHSRHVSTLLWAMARLGAHSPRVSTSAQSWLAATDLTTLTEQSLVMTLWAMTSMSCASTDTLADVECELLRRGLARFQPQELNAAVFAFSMSLSSTHTHTHTHTHLHKFTHAHIHTHTHTHTYTHTNIHIHTHTRTHC